MDDQSSISANSGNSASKLLRYPLRSATKPKADNSPVPEFISSATKRGRPASTVSQSVCGLASSGKDKLAKPPRRLSVPKPIGNVTPISEASARRSAKSETPLSDVSKSLIRKKFSTLSSASYWVSQIKLSESAAKHSISLGFFKLALEAGCEPIQRMRDELKTYARKHNLVELGESVKALFESYNISENFEQLQVSETCTHVPGDGNKLSDDDVRSSSSVAGTRKLKPKSLNALAHSASQIKESAKESKSKSNTVTKVVKGPVNKNSPKARLASEVSGLKTEKKLQKPRKHESSKEKKPNKVKKQGKEVVHEEGPVILSPAEDGIEENKENMENDTQMEEEMTATEIQG